MKNAFKKNTKLLKSILSIIFVLELIGISFQAVHAWTEPTVAPPNGNVSAPINASSISQGKLGSLGIGTTTPTSRLDIQNSIDTAAAMSIKDAAGNAAIEIRPTSAALKNIFIGLNSGSSNTTGMNNVAVGLNSLKTLTTGISNVAIGPNVLFANTTGDLNVGIGFGALYANTNGIYNTGLGAKSLWNNTSGSYNIALGAYSLFANTTGNNNVASGYYALAMNTDGNYNVGNGFYALANNQRGSFNDAIGGYALRSNIDGSANIANGYYALEQNTSGGNNVANGFYALQNNTSGSNNVAEGASSLKANVSGNQNTAIGSNADVSVGNLTNATAIGANAIVSASNALILGNNANVGIGISSPTAKLDVVDSSVGGTAIKASNFSPAGATAISGGGSDYGVYGFTIGARPTQYGVYGVVAQGNGAGVWGGHVGGGNDFKGFGGEFAKAGVWTNASDRNTKENFTQLDNQEILEKIKNLNITQWNYKLDPGAKHIGPIAQDFYQIFGLGDDDKHISTIDPAGISLIGVQALYEKMKIQQEKIEVLENEISNLKSNK